MGSTGSTATASATDGRRRRAERSRDRVVGAVRELLAEGVDTPTAPQVARRSGVSERSVYRLFSDLESMYAAVIEVQWREVAPRYADLPAGGDTAERVAALVARRSAVYEEVAPLRRVGERLRASSPTIAAALDATRVELRAQLERHLAPELDPLPARRRAVLADALESAASFRTWDGLRTDQACSVAAARRAVEATLTALLA